MKRNNSEEVPDVKIFDVKSCVEKYRGPSKVKVFEVDPNQKIYKRLTTAIGARTYAEHDFEACIAVFHPGRKTTLHTHSSDQLLYIIAGKGVVGTETEQHLATPGKVFVTPKGQPHFQAAAKDSTLTFLFVQKYPYETIISDVYVPITVV